jgi:AcrR family transcriptional regulator
MAAEEDPNPWRLGPEATKPLPRGRHSLPREQVTASQHGRMLHAALVVTARKGFGYVVIGDIVAEAGVSRKAFYEHFKDFEDCWFEAYETASTVLFEQMTSAAIEAGGADDRELALRVAIAQLTRMAAEEPEVAHATNIDVCGGGPEGLKAYQGQLRRWVNLLLITWDGETAAKSSGERRFAALAAVSILYGIIREYLIAGEVDQLPAISDQISTLMAEVLSQ